MANIEDNINSNISIEEITSKAKSHSDEDDSPLHETIYVKKDITTIKGIGPFIADKLKGRGFTSVEQIADSTPDRLSQIPGIGLSTAQKIIKNAKEYNGSQPSIKKLNDFTKEDNQTELKSSEDKWFDNKYQRPETEKWYPPTSNIELDSDIEYESEFIQENDFTDADPFENEDKAIDNILIPSTVAHEEVPHNGVSDFIEDSLEDEITEIPPHEMVNAPPVQYVSTEKEEVKIPPEFLSFPTMPTDIPSGERLSESTVHDIKKVIHESFTVLGFSVMPKSAKLKRMFVGIDLVGVKVVPVDDLIKLNFIVPVKICSYKGNLHISQDFFKYISSNEKNQNATIDTQITSDLTLLYQCAEKIFISLATEGIFLPIFRDFLKLDITVESTITSKSLFFHSGPIQYHVVIDPVYVNGSKVVFLDKIIPFAYQRESNIHVVSEAQFTELLHYFEKKYCLTESNKLNEPQIKVHNNSRENLMNNMRYTAIPPFMYGVFLLFLYSFQAELLFTFFSSLGAAIIFLYIGICVFLYIKYSMISAKIKKEFRTPYYKRVPKFDETSLILVKESLSTELMAQFSYECLNIQFTSKVIDKLEMERSEEILTREEITPEIKEDQFFEEEEDDHTVSEISKKVIKKYSSFLED